MVFYKERSGMIMREAEISSAKRPRYVNYRRRQLIFRRICLISAIVISTLTLIAAAGILSHAQDNDEDHYYKYYTSITVMPGDTLYSIAASYGENYEDIEAHVMEIAGINHLCDDTIYAGSSLIVPYYSTEFR